MLAAHHPLRNRPQQRGLVLLLSLIVLAAMSLAAIGLMRSVLTSNRVAANLAFQQSATQSADVGVERAVAWLEQKSRELEEVPGIPAGAPKTTRPANKLFQDIDIGGAETIAYRAIREDPGVGQSWENFWQQRVANNQVNMLPADAAGNTVGFLIQRLCVAAGDPLAGASCEAAPTLSSSSQTSSKSSGIKLQVPGQTYYRITVRVQGPRNAVSFVQSVVAL